jgi:SM-20-related protein
MPKYDLLSALGLFVVEDFLEADDCARLRDEMRSASLTAATVLRRGVSGIDDGVRKTKRAAVSSATEARLRRRLQAARPRLEDHFGLRLRRCEDPQFLVYRAGDFFALHEDSSDHPDDPQYIQGRRVSAVIFLNGQRKAAGPESYSGGSLVLYGLLGGTRGETIGFPVPAAAGLLVAFRSDVKHEVKEVVQGERYTIVSWFL